MINMGALKMGIAEEDLPDIVTKWRNANKNIVRMWYDFGNAAEAVLTQGKGKNEPQYLPHGIVIRLESNDGRKCMTMQLPSGRKLYYVDPKLAPAPRFPDKLSIHYMGMNQMTHKWVDIDTHGGKLVENCTQAVARDILCETLMRLYRAGFMPVFHVHDEVIIEAPTESKEEALALMLKIMSEPPEWAKGLPLAGAGFTADFYQKD